MTADCLKNLKALNERAGEWYAVAEKGTVDICTRKPRRPSVVALMLSPEDAECIIAEHEAVPALLEEIARLRGALELAQACRMDLLILCDPDIFDPQKGTGVKYIRPDVIERFKALCAALEVE